MNNSFRNETVRTLVQSYTVAQFNEKYLADKEFRKFARKVYAYFDNMRHGTRLRLTAYQGRKLEWYCSPMWPSILKGHIGWSSLYPMTTTPLYGATSLPKISTGK